MVNIIEEIGEAAAWEQLAEEASELSHAALKMARVIRNENPTPVNYFGALRSCKEELGDVENVVGVLKLRSDEYTRKEKMYRWKKRILEVKYARRKENVIVVDDPLAGTEEVL